MTRCPCFDIQHSSTQHAVYVQDEIKLGRWFIVNAGLRYDGYEQFVRVTPRAALIFLPSSTQSLKYLYGSAFRAPNEYELNTFYFGERVNTLRPESIDTHELVWERYINDRLRTSVSTYWYKADRLITDDARRLDAPGRLVRQPGSSAGEGPRARSADAPQRRIAGAGELRASERRGSADARGAPEFAASRRQGAHQPARANASVVRVGRGTVSQQPHHAGRLEGVRCGDRQRHLRPTARTLLGALRRRSKSLQRRLFGSRFRSAPAGCHPAERPDGPDRAELDAAIAPAAPASLLSVSAGMLKKNDHLRVSAGGEPPPSIFQLTGPVRFEGSSTAQLEGQDAGHRRSGTHHGRRAPR